MPRWMSASSADRDGLGLLDEAHLAEVGLARRRDAHRRGGVERRGVDRRHELRGEEGAHRLPHHVRADDPGDAEAVRELRGERALAHARPAADEDDQRSLEAAQLLPLAEALDEDVALRRPELVARDLVQVGEGEGRRPAAPQAPLHGGRHVVGALGRQPGRHERLRHEALAERRLVALVDERDVVVLRHRHALSSRGRRGRGAGREALGGERRQPVDGRSQVAVERHRLVVAEHELAAGGGGALGDDVHRRRLDLGEEHLGLGGRALHGVGQPAAVGEVARDEHDLGAVVGGERRAPAPARRPAGAVVKKATRRPRTDCAGRGRNTVGRTSRPGLTALAAAVSAATSPGVANGGSHCVSTRASLSSRR